jgi:hypothetical protein
VLAQLQRQLEGEILYTGLEISPQALLIAQSKANRNLSFRNAAIPDSVADLLLLIDVFEHVEDHLGFLESLVSYGRRFIFHIPLDLILAGRIRPVLRLLRRVLRESRT